MNLPSSRPTLHVSGARRPLYGGLGAIALALTGACSSPAEGIARTSAATTSTNATLPGTEPEAGVEGIRMAGDEAGLAPDAGPAAFGASSSWEATAEAGAADTTPSVAVDEASAAAPSGPGAVEASPVAPAAPLTPRAVPLETGGSGHIVYLLGKGWNAIAASAGAAPNAISGALDALSAGNDSFVNLSSDGAFLALDTSRFGCSGDCLGLSAIGLANAGLVGTQPSNARPAVAAGGNVLVVPTSGGPHALDLYAIRRGSSSSPWGAPVLLTGGSSAAFHHDPSISWDGSRVTFDCGPTPYQANASDICDVALDGSGFRVVATATGGPGGSADNETHHPSYAPDGSIVFEADWGGSERIWRIDGTSPTPMLVTPAGITDDNSPCVLPDGRIASLWLGRSGNPQGLHELKVMQPDGSGAVMLLEDVDVVDVGLSCGK